ncbi:hypothetical protein L1049_010463 [Liquidambar formosana]|uniref:Uncharacterized protein n=1 Tax=Liquidambar formosana TaxID=63359 RepID=A0AAP0NBJ1_LIQFO
MWPPSSHTNFFSSLRQVEKRLKTENPSDSSTPSSPPARPYISTWTNPTTAQPFKTANPHRHSSQIPQTSHQPIKIPPQINGPDSPKTTNDVEEDEIDDIERLIQLLGLSDCREEEQEEESGNCGGNSCHCEGGFYAKIVGVKGPKCVKEVERLEGWIKHFSSGGVHERIEPLRLAHLLLGKAAFVLGDTSVFGGLEFPSTIEGIFAK